MHIFIFPSSCCCGCEGERWGGRGVRGEGGGEGGGRRRKEGSEDNGVKTEVIEIRSMR